MARRTERRYAWKLESLGNHEDDGDKTSQIRILKNEKPVFLHALLVRFLNFCNFEDVLLVTRKLKKRRRQRQRHKSMIWLAEWRKIIVLHVRHALWCIFFWRRLPNDDVKFSDWIFWRQRQLARVDQYTRIRRFLIYCVGTTKCPLNPIPN